jgi:hypothetical protein
MKLVIDLIYETFFTKKFNADSMFCNFNTRFDIYKYMCISVLGC